MPGQRPILAMSFIASLGITFEVLACTLPKGQSNFWPLITTLFYILTPVPMIMSRRASDGPVIGLDRKTTVKARDFALFFTAGLMVSTFALPIFLTRTPIEDPTIKPIQCFLAEVGTLLCFTTMGLFYLYFMPV